MSQISDCVVAGHVCLDIAPLISAGGKTIGEVFRPGKLIDVGPASISTGGSVSNTGVPLRRLGVNVKLMGKCGDDIFGLAILDCLRREAAGAEAGMQVVPGEKTSYSVVLNVPGLDRMFLHCPGSNDTFTAEDVNYEAVATARLFHFGYPPLMAKMFADGGMQTTEMLQRVRQAGATTSLDLALPDPASPAGKANWQAILAQCLPYVDIFTPSVEELTFMLRRSVFDDLMARSGGHLISLVDGQLLEDLGERCIAAGVGIVIIKCGEAGIYVRTAGRGRLERFGRCKPDLANWTNRELLAPSYKVPQVVSATGAGDCAIAGFLTACLRGLSVEQALRCACAVGAQNVQAADSVSGVKTWDFTLRQTASRPTQNEMSLALPRWRRSVSEGCYTGPNDGKA